MPAETYDLTNIGTLFAFMLVSIGVLVLRYTEPDAPPAVPRCRSCGRSACCSAAGCLFIMVGAAAHRVGAVRHGGSAIGLVLYFTYGYRHGKLRVR